MIRIRTVFTILVSKLQFPQIKKRYKKKFQGSFKVGLTIFRPFEEIWGGRSAKESLQNEWCVQLQTENMYASRVVY